jgi:Fic family protein
VPEVDLTSLRPLLERADQAIGRLDGVASIVPDPKQFLYVYVRKEALLSSQIEGTQSSLSDLLRFEAEQAPGVPLEDVLEVSNYVAAMDHGLARLRGGFPLSLRLIREIHGVLLSRGRGRDKDPGEFRRTQNWIGGSRPGNALYVPPPAHVVLDCMGALELFIHDTTPGMPTLIRAGLMHVQFESIHPFLDGNGRLGRLLISFLLCERGILREPLLYLSLYLKQHRERYYALLQEVRVRGAWEAWLEFFLAGIAETATQAVDTARRILDIFEEDRRLISAAFRPVSAILRVHDHLRARPLTTIRETAKALSLSQPTITICLQKLESLGIVREITGQRRGRVYVYQRYLDVLSEGTAPLPR